MLDLDLDLSFSSSGIPLNQPLDLLKPSPALDQANAVTARVEAKDAVDWADMRYTHLYDRKFTVLFI